MRARRWSNVMRTFEQQPRAAFQPAAPVTRPVLLPDTRHSHAASTATFDFSQIALHQPTRHDDLLGTGDQQATPQLGEPRNDPEQLASGPKIDQLKVLTSSTGAFSGFPTINGIDLNAPTAFNDTTTTGTCVNVHQMQFH